MALAQEADQYRSGVGRRTFDTVYTGGGTPTVLSSAQLFALITCVRDHFRIEPDAEWTVEANPGTITPEKLDVLRSQGINRLSIGVQSFSDDRLRSLGRSHSAAEAREAVKGARSAGFENISLDLIYGVPGQGMDEWRRTLNEAVEMKPEHVSAYCLSVDEGSRLFREAHAGRYALPAGEEAAAMYDVLVASLGAAGYGRYEISNFAKPGYECRHNANYWENGEYLGLGASAWSFLGGVRRMNAADVSGYCSALSEDRLPLAFEERAGDEESAAEALFLGLRTEKGIDLRRFGEKHGDALAGRVRRNMAPLISRGLLSLSGGVLRLAGPGVFVSDEVAVRLWE